LPPAAFNRLALPADNKWDVTLLPACGLAVLFCFMTLFDVRKTDLETTV
jgi:hypothetical protein